MENNNIRHQSEIRSAAQKRRKIPKWKRFLRRYRFYIVTALFLAAIAVCVVILCRGCSKTPGIADFNGMYYIDDYTAYEFDGKGKGAMRLGETTRYVFDYTINDDEVTFDFKDVQINDATYTFELSGDRITITELRGGNSYTMSKK